MRCARMVAVIWLVGFGPGSLFADEPQLPLGQASLKHAVEQSLPYLERAGVGWMDERKCISCHRVAFLSWTFNEARRKGIPVDNSKLQSWLERSVESSLKSPAEGKPLDAATNLDGVAQMVLGHPASAPAALSAETRATFVKLILAGQQPDGSWKPAGQLPRQKRPAEETTQVSTMWLSLALGAVDDLPEVTAARQRAAQRLETAIEPKSTEWYVARLLLSVRDRSATEVEERTASLKAQQNADGGWGWLVGDTSDALGTGMALYALALAGTPADDAAVRRAQQFLVSTQQPDGSWAVRGTKAAKKDRIEETATYWGTAWAALGLLQTLP